MNDENDKYDHPWSEEEWLAEFRRNDVRNAKFGELLETLSDDPDRNEKINREMGWNRDDGIDRPWVEEFDADAAAVARELEEQRRWRESFDVPDDEVEDDGDVFDESEDETFDDASDDATARTTSDEETADEETADEGPDDDDEAFLSAHEHDPDPDYGRLGNIPPYALGMSLAVETVKLANTYPESNWQNADHYELFCDSVGQMSIPAAKIAGGHSYGYDTNICANIVYNRFALEAVEKSLAGFAELQEAGALPAEFRDKVVPRLDELRRQIVDRIASLRKRVWW